MTDRSADIAELRSDSHTSTHPNGTVTGYRVTCLCGAMFWRRSRTVALDALIEHRRG